MAEIISHYFPKLVEIHNYIASTSAATKLSNWSTLNSILSTYVRKSAEETELPGEQERHRAHNNLHARHYRAGAEDGSQQGEAGHGEGQGRHAQRSTQRAVIPQGQQEPVAEGHNGRER